MRPIDLQVNGYAGTDFNRDGLTAEGLHHACHCLEEDGNDTILATFITDTIPNLENRIRSSDAIATRDCDMYVLSVENYNLLAEDHKRIALVLMTKLARLLSIRLRHTNEELALLQDT